MSRVARYLAIAMLLLVVCGEASAQKMKERKLVREGNEFFDKEEFDNSIDSYEKALNHKPDSFEAKFNLASALYCAGRYAEAENTLAPLLNDESLSETERGEVAYNMGNIEFAQKKYKEALSMYRRAMRCNPNDEDAKYNYALTKLKLQQQQQQQQDKDKNEQEQQKEENQEKNQDNNDQNNDQNQEKSQGQGNGDQNGDQNKEQNNENNSDQNDKDKGGEDSKNDDNKKDSKNDNNQGGEQPQNQGGEQPQNQGGEQPQNQGGEDKPQQGGGEPSKDGGMSQEQQEAILQAIQAEEDKTQEKVNKGKAGVLIYGGKNW